MTTAAVIVAAGRGRRAGGGLPKQWRSVAGKPVARWTLERFAALMPVVMVIHPDDTDFAKEVSTGLDVMLAHGGADRSASVLAGLAALEHIQPDHVLIHELLSMHDAQHIHRIPGGRFGKHRAFDWLVG